MVVSVIPAVKTANSLANVGADIVGVDLSKPVDDETFEVIKKAWTKYSVIRFREQKNMSDGDQIAFSRLFGALDEAPVMEGGQTVVEGYPEIYVVSNVLNAEGRPIGSLGAGEAVWHTDMSFLEKPPKASSLFSLEIPKSGGASTWFLDAYAAYENMPLELKKKIAGKRIKHDGTHNSGGFLRAGATLTTDPSKSFGQYHPAVVVHPESQRTCLYLGRRYLAYVEGLSLEDSEALLDDLWAWVQRPEFSWEHKWQLNDLVLWDNRCTLHRRDAFDAQERRILHRTQIKGEAPPMSS